MVQGCRQRGVTVLTLGKVRVKLQENPATSGRIDLSSWCSVSPSAGRRQAIGRGYSRFCLSNEENEVPSTPPGSTLGRG